MSCDAKPVLESCEIINTKLSLDKAKSMIDYVMSLSVKPTWINVSIQNDGTVNVSFSYDKENDIYVRKEIR